MNAGYVFLLIQPMLFLAFLLIAGRWSPVRREQLATAARLMAANPGAEQREEILPLQGSWRTTKQSEIENRVREMQQDGWTFLKMTVVSPWISLRYWGGAVRMHYIRVTAPDLHC